jgi:transposase
MGKATENLARVTRIGRDLAKSVFQVHGVGAQGEVVIARKLRRGTMSEFFGRLAPCVVAMEACGPAHHWGRQLVALGHEVKLMPPAHVKPYVRRSGPSILSLADSKKSGPIRGSRLCCTLQLRALDRRIHRRG